MRYSLVFTSLILSTSVFSGPVKVPGAETVAGNPSQRLSSSNQAENYAAKNGPGAQQDLQKGKEVAQQVMAENPNIPEANVRAGKHSGGSQGADQVTLQVPAAPGQYNPPPKGPGAGSVAAHVTSQPGPTGREQIDKSKPIVTQPIPGAAPPNPANPNQGKTSSFNPANPVPLNGPVTGTPKPPIKKSKTMRRDLGRRAVKARLVEEYMRQELVRRGLEMELMGQEPSWVF